MNAIPRANLPKKKPAKISSLQLTGKEPSLNPLTAAQRNHTLMNLATFKEDNKVTSVHKVQPQTTARMLPRVITSTNLLQSRRNSLHIIKSETLKLPSDCLIFTVEIEENYGDENQVTLNSLLFLSKDRQVITPWKIISLPELPKEHLKELLCDEKMTKEKYFIAPFNNKDENDGKVTLIVHITTDKNPSYVRIWNTRENPTSNTKSITISCSDTICYHGEIPKGFGVDVPISGFKGVPNSQSNKILFELFPNLAPEPFVKDDYGNFPISATKTITIEVVSTYGSPKLAEIGLYGIDFFSSRDELVSEDKIQGIKVNGCKSIIGTEQIFKPNSYSTDWKDMFTAEVVDWEKTNPSFEITFKNPIRIVRMSFFNFNSCERNLNAGFKHIRMKFNNRLAYAGNLKKGNGLSGSSQSITDIWFCDVPKLRDG